MISPLIPAVKLYQIYTALDTVIKKLVKSFLGEVCQLQWTLGWWSCDGTSIFFVDENCMKLKEEDISRIPIISIKFTVPIQTSKTLTAAVKTPALQLSGWNITVRSGQILSMPWLKVPTCNRGPSSYSLVLLHSRTREKVVWSWFTQPRGKDEADPA